MLATEYRLAAFREDVLYANDGWTRKRGGWPSGVDHDAIKWNRIMIPSLWFEHHLRANAFRVCCERKPVPFALTRPFGVRTAL